MYVRGYAHNELHKLLKEMTKRLPNSAFSEPIVSYMSNIENDERGIGKRRDEKS